MHTPTTAAKMTLSLLAHALALVAQPRMGLFDSLPGFWKVACPPGYARASHCLFLGTDDAAKQKATAVLERVQSGSLTLAAAARQFSCCPTRDQEPAGDLGTFASLSAMRGVDEMLSFDGIMELPYENQDTRAFDDAVFSAPLNQPTLIQSQWGFHIFVVTERGGGERAVVAPAAPANAFADLPAAEVKQVDTDVGRSM